MNKRIITITTWLLLSVPLFSTAQTIETGTVTDIDGNEYATVKLGDYWWTTENLKTYHYNNGDTVELFTGSKTTASYDYMSYCSYPNNDTNNVATYGLNYSWSAATNEKGLCPDGWELPDTAIWYNLAKAVGVGNHVVEDDVDGGWSELGKYLKSASWTNESSVVDSLGFNALPSGILSTTGYVKFETEAHFWTPNYVHSDSSGSGRRYMYLKTDSDTLYRGQYRNVNHLSVRCVKAAEQEGTSIDEANTNNTVSVYPNPAAALITLAASVGSSWKLVDIKGKNYLSGIITETLTSIDIKSLPKGTYMIIVSCDTGEKIIKKIIKK